MLSELLRGECREVESQETDGLCVMLEYGFYIEGNAELLTLRKEIILTNIF